MRSLGLSDFATFGGVDSVFQHDRSTYLPFALGHKVVVVFFVLSGYVITYVACERERGLRDFVLARVARITRWRYRPSF